MLANSVLLIIIFLNCKYVSCAHLSKEKSPLPRTFSSCFEDIGCIDVTEKWFHDKYRPKNLEPLDRHTIRTEFLLMKTPKNSSHDLLYDVMSIKRESVEVAGFKKETCSIFIIHDFTSNGYTGWVKHLVIAFSKKTDCNIISIDWQAGAEPPFEQAIANARVVALEAKAFIALLRETFKQSTDTLHIVGHGVGAHIAGYIGKYVPGVQRITGLDPTGQFFDKMPIEVRLDAEDAKYVEILHTDAFNHRSQGTKIPYGHVDFIINNADHQPGCNDSSHLPAFTELRRDSLQEGKILPDCSHKRSFKYYIQSIEDDQCQFIGIKCANYKSFIDGKCNNCHIISNRTDCATFGLELPSTLTRNNTYYLLTNSKKPFCMVTYGINITVVSGSVIKELEGYFEFILVDENNRVTNATTNTNDKIIRKFDSGHAYGFVLYALPPAINKIKEAKVKWIYKSKRLCILCDKSIPVKEIAIKRLTVKHDSSVVTNIICPATKGTELKSGDYVQFHTCESLYGSESTKNCQKPNPHQHMDNQTLYCEGVDKLLGKNASTVNPPSAMISKSLGSRGVPIQVLPATKSEFALTTTESTPMVFSITLDLKDANSDKELRTFKDCFDSRMVKRGPQENNSKTQA